MTKIAVAGAAGRMGQMIITCALRNPEMRIVGAVECKGHPKMKVDAAEIAGLPACGVLLTDNMETALADADVLIDFTLHDTAPLHADIASRMRRAIVIGATGLTPPEKDKIIHASSLVPVVWSPNMSLGVNLLFAMTRKAASVLGKGYSVELEETHHIHKKDAPSGTALRLGEKAAEGRGVNFDSSWIHDPEGKGEIHDASKIVIRSYRRGEVVGDHVVRFENAGETVELTHKAYSREAFAMGALRAAAWVSTRKPRLYDMQDVLGLE